MEWAVGQVRTTRLAWRTVLPSAARTPPVTPTSNDASGYVGEFATGSIRSGTGGASYSVRSTTAVPTSAATQSEVISTTVNKGIYMISITMKCAASVSTYFSGSLRVGGTAIINNLEFNANSSATGTATCCVPVVITSDATTVSGFALIGSGTSSNSAHEMWIVRIA